MILPLVIGTASLAAALTGLHAIAVRRWERTVTGRLAPAADGIIPGAGPIDLPADRPRGAVLLIHGFGDTPQTLARVAQTLHQRGYAVRAPLLPGHGRTLRDFAASGSEEWIEQSRAEYESLRRRYGPVAIVGLSMGGALAAIIAAEQPDVPALVLLAPYLDAPPLVRRAAVARRLLAIVMPYIAGRSERSIHDPQATAESLAYRASTPRLLHELVSVADRGRAALARVVAPALIVQSTEDNRIAPGVALAARDLLGSAEKQLVWVAGCGHVLTVDYGWEHVANATCDWIERHPFGATRLAG